MVLTVLIFAQIIANLKNIFRRILYGILPNSQLKKYRKYK